ncbi:TPA: DUF4236 domain-containing protein [Clostridioides difficile]|nr:DUF4236 domain-containing protein [Clostridioides difficile]
MGLRIYKRVKICKGLHLNFSKSGVSTSIKVGNMTYNTRGRLTTKICDGVSYTVNTKKGKKVKPSTKPQTGVDDLVIHMADRNIQQWEQLGSKVPFLKGLCNLMIKINTKNKMGAEKRKNV